ncbi:amino acid adenylation enzyme/thioester reductase family protein [Cylindrospermum stagnale PCC 7417]|uniref:Amino acid adenylation enzyme/thioester reductase family protein n=1 Tax=Cylindrospermum stagnale PCC 7417 TaxID=56107 RepID=K9WUC5_9NOST|nr:non-ribosomal peptide synthetase [Cylindrospermum stagnale]AFZ23808.1 amino acid adenylation enzyme/thioester reductase family protein [Cylindrospermum stagnale PCC 7417]
MQKQTYGFKLSPQQRRLWFLQQDCQVYSSYCAVLLEGNLDKEILKEALYQVVKRHEILRTSFHSTRGIKSPVQVISDNIVLSITEYYLESKETLENDLEQLFKSANQRNFDWEQGRLLGINLVTLLPQKHILLFSLPAICADIQALNHLVCELSRCYVACLRGEEVSGEAIQYADIAEWQNQFLETEDLDYWKEFDIYSLGNLKLPYSKQQTYRSEFKPECFRVKVASDLIAKINAIIQQTNISKHIFFLTCWQILLWRLTDNSDMIIGTASDGRYYEELKESLGLLVKYLPLQCHFEGNYKFSDLLLHVEEATEEIFASHNSFCLDKNTELDGNRSEQIFFPFCFEYESVLGKQYAGDVCFSIYQQYSCVDRFQVKLSCVDQNDGISAEFFYDANIFTLEEIQRLASQFEMLLASVVKNPEGAIGSFDILSPNERTKLLVEFNNTKTVVPQYQCIHHWFESQCDRIPDDIAVVYENQQLTYSELNARSNQLAHYLQQLGVAPEVIVGICVERSLEMLVGVLGILKAGGAYLPLDPNHPQERLAFILGETSAPILLTQQRLLPILPDHSAHLLCLDCDWEKVAQQDTDNLAGKTTADNLAYIIYTSGSTGKPKGTLIPHRGLVNYLTWCTQAYAVELGQGAVVHSSLAFDLTITGLFSPLLVGRCVELLPEDQSIESLCNALRKGSNYSLVKITPAQLQLLSHQLSPSEAKGLTRAFIIGGENLLAESITFWQKFAPDTMLINEYGPTETVVGCCIYQVPSGEMLSGSIPIGQPIANTELYVLNQNYQPMPIGVAGELYIGGAGLARGYLNRPELTAEKFIPHPFSDEPGARLYKTGDLVRFRSDGNLEFLGRIDHQVKVRGFRIELGEIEGLLVQHPGVQETVVIVREDTPGDQRLIAYVVAVRGVTPAPNELRSYLKEQLPEYMIPSVFVLLNALPLTTNGKVDRQALPAPNQSDIAQLGKTFVAPHTPVEEMLAGVWAQILGIQQVGINDNFFELGGHSLLATQVISQVRKAFGVELTLRYLFKSPTVAGLAKDIEMAIKAEPELKSVPSLERVSRDIELPLSFAQQRLWFIHQLDPDSSAYNGADLVRLQGKLNVAALEESINEIVRRHEALRTCFVAVEGRSHHSIIPELRIPLPVMDLQHLSAAEQEQKVRSLEAENAQQPFNLKNVPLLRLLLLRLTTEEHILLVTMHHIISDAWSGGIFIREISALYQAFSTGKPSPLPELPIQYADYAVWQQKLLQGETLNTQLNYWKQQLKNAKTVLELPTDKPRSQLQTCLGKKHSFALSPKLSNSIKSLSQRENATLFMTLLAAFNVLLYHYTEQEDILIGSPIANRNRSELEELIGFFVNTLLLRTNLSHNPSFQEILQRVKAMALGAYANQDIPFEKLVAELQPERSLNHSPLFQVWFVLQNAPKSNLEMEGLNLTILETDSSMVRHDLKLQLSETPTGLQGFFEYKTDLFHATTITRMAGILETLLTIISEQPDIKLDQLVKLLQETEKQQQMLQQQELQQTRIQKLGKIGRKTITGQIES